MFRTPASTKAPTTSTRVILMSRVHLELSDPPDGIAIDGVEAVGAGTDLLIHIDAAKAAAGLQGNLIVTAFTERAVANPKNKNARPRTPIGTLPATETMVRVVEATRYGAPMTTVRVGEERDIAAMVAMARPFTGLLTVKDCGLAGFEIRFRLKA